MYAWRPIPYESCSVPDLLAQLPVLHLPRQALLHLVHLPCLYRY